jgi:hypothetical protein
VNAAPPTPSVTVSRELVALAIGRLRDESRSPTVCRIQAAVRDHDGIELSFREIIEARKPAQGSQAWATGVRLRPPESRSIVPYLHRSKGADRMALRLRVAAARTADRWFPWSGVAAVWLLLLTDHGPAVADTRAPPTASELYLECSNGQEGCYAYLAGFADGLVLAARGGREPMICPVGAVNTVQLKLIFMAYAESHSQWLGLARGDITLTAFMDAFPCRNWCFVAGRVLRILAGAPQGRVHLRQMGH